MSTNLSGNLIYQPAPGQTLVRAGPGTTGTEPGTQPTGAGVLYGAASIAALAAITAPQGTIAPCANGEVAINTDGSTVWTGMGAPSLAFMQEDIARSTTLLYPPAGSGHDAFTSTLSVPQDGDYQLNFNASYTITSGVPAGGTYASVFIVGVILNGVFKTVVADGGTWVRFWDNKSEIILNAGGAAGVAGVGSFVTKIPLLTTDTVSIGFGHVLQPTATFTANMSLRQLSLLRVT